MSNCSSAALACVPATFSSLSLFGGQIVEVSTNLVTNYTSFVSGMFRYTQPDVLLENATFCNVTVTYTHPGESDNINVETWLPTKKNWNGRLQSVGGSGSIAGRFSLAYGNMEGALADGYATSSTDAGLVQGESSTAGWALLSPGNVNWDYVQNFASRSLGDMAVISKGVIESFYGTKPAYTYWNGCSTGGRQGHMLAQRYPDAYDGIAAGSPAINWGSFIAATAWPQQFMDMMGIYPPGCEIDALTAAAITACDALDGIVDGIVSDADACLASFDPFSLVGTVVTCNNGSTQISTAAAAVVNATWHGPETRFGKKIWYGFTPGTDITGSAPYSDGTPGVASTICHSGGGPCSGAEEQSVTEWFTLLVAKDPNFPWGNVSHAVYDRLVHASINEYQSVLWTSDPDLTEFREAGGKMVTFHGLADTIVPPKGTEDYYMKVSALFPDVQDFYRYFEVPGMGHCAFGKSGQPSSLFSQLRAWVENGTAPVQTPIQVLGLDGMPTPRILCAFPKVARLDEACKSGTSANCWICVDRS
ncbi:Tannase/feruloyl esterase [Podospora didyma]|uniref:Carboxylic ester hydrolase n=1 Tax=Podospora didyma TaxID=330526 RepID=A0AAE0NYF0_9PEZI|nr:Tannase/feruloyl esterase [Podospora didyma]